MVSDQVIVGGGWGGATCQIQRETLPHMVSVYECVWGVGGVDNLRDTDETLLHMVSDHGGWGGV